MNAGHLYAQVNISGQSETENWTEEPHKDEEVADVKVDEWSDDWDSNESPWSHSGFIELGLGEKYNNDRLFFDQSSLNEVRWHQSYDYIHESFDVNLDFDLWFDAAADTGDELVFDLRELNIKFSLFDQTDVVLGRQISTWGTGDLLFINDLFPKDWVSFFSGRDASYLKAPIDALRVTSYFKAFNFDLVITPIAEPDRFINGERFSLFYPLAQNQVGGFEVINPRNTHQAEYALRLFKKTKSNQLALYAYHGIAKSPTGVDNAMQVYFPQKNVFGASLQSGIGKGLYNIEIGYHQALDDQAGDNPFIPNSQWRALMGYERELFKKFNWGIQYYIEHSMHYDRLRTHSLFPQTEPEQNRQVITNRLTYLTQQDKLTWSLFVFYSPTDEDSYWRPSINYRYNDSWQFILGASVFTGKDPHTFFGQFEDSSNVYSRIRYQF